MPPCLTNVIHVESNPLLDYLSSALTLKVEEIRSWNPDLLATGCSSSGDVKLPENEKSDDNIAITTTVVVTNVHDTPSLLSVETSAVRTFVDREGQNFAGNEICLQARPVDCQQ